MFRTNSVYTTYWAQPTQALMHAATQLFAIAGYPDGPATLNNVLDYPT